MVFKMEEEFFSSIVLPSILQYYCKILRHYWKILWHYLKISGTYHSLRDGFNGRYMEDKFSLPSSKIPINTCIDVDFVEVEEIL